MYAIIKTGGKQYKVQEGDVIFVEKLDASEGDAVKFNEVIAIGSDDGFNVGSPFISGACVDAKILKNGKAKKIIVFKYKPKKGYRNKQGHRQPYSKVEIGKISV